MAEKHKVTFAALRNRAEKESWSELKTGQQHKISTKLAQKTAEKIADAESDYMVNIARLNHKIAEKIDKLLSGADEPEPRAVKALTSALKDINDIQNNIKATSGETGASINENLVSLIEVLKDSRPPHEIRVDADE